MAFDSEQDKRIWAAAEELDRLLAAMNLSDTDAVNAASRLYTVALSTCLGAGCDNETKKDIINIVGVEVTKCNVNSVRKSAGLVQIDSAYIN